ncbi:MAG: hypothetical protein ACYSWU_05545 [Planctomycetota bacterium]|jgi:hypothetical protein
MKKLLILTAVLMLTSSAVGCRCCNWLWRGAAYNPCTPAVTYSDPCPPYNPCDPCATGQPAFTPGPAPYSGPAP